MVPVGTISDKYRNGNVFTPKLEMKITNENDASGTQARLLSSAPRDVEKVKRLMIASPMDMPRAESDSSSFRPALSTRNVHKIAPITCTAPTIIDETLGDRVEPDDSKIVAVKFIIGKHPQNMFRAISAIP